MPLLARQVSQERRGQKLGLPSDEDLMEGVRTKDCSALDALFRRYARLVMAVAFRTLRDQGEAEDVVQETFLYLYEKAPLFDAQKGTAKAWIVQVAFHRALDRRSYLARRGFYSGTEIELVSDTLAGMVDFERDLEAKLSCTKLEKAFADLPHTQRQTLQMFFFEGMEMREIAGKLGESLGNIRHYYYRGLERLRMSSFVRKVRSVHFNDSMGR